MAMEINGNGSGMPVKEGHRQAKPEKGDFLEAFQVMPQGRFRETGSGLKVAVLREGSGTPLENGMRLKVKYTGWLPDGTRFDSSTDRNQPFELVLGTGRVIRGWEEGLAGIKPGERRQLIVPPQLAYGDRQQGKIPPGSTLIFNVEAVAVEAATSNPKGNMSVVA